MTSRVPIQHIRAHVNTLFAVDMRTRDIADDAGIKTGWLSRLLYGTDIRTVSADTAKAVLAVTPRPVDRLLRDTTGTHRRLQALMRAGWSQTRIAQVAGYERTIVSYWLSRPTLTCDVVDTVREVYERLCTEDGGSTRTRQWAKQHGWPPPEAWSDETIDDPQAQPYDWCRGDNYIDEVKVARVNKGDLAWADLNTAEKEHLLATWGGKESTRTLAARWQMPKRTLERWTARINSGQVAA